MVVEGTGAFVSNGNQWSSSVHQKIGIVDVQDQVMAAEQFANFRL